MDNKMGRLAKLTLAIVSGGAILMAAAGPVAGIQEPQTNTGIGQYRVDNHFDWLKKRLSPGPVFGFLQDYSGRSWITGRRLYTYEEPTEKFNQAFDGPNLVAIAETPEGTIWCSAVFPLPNIVASFDGATWHLFTGRTLLEQIVGSPSRSDQRVHLVFSGRDGRVWFALDDGLICYDGRSWTAHLGLRGMLDVRAGSTPTVRAGLEDREGIIWLSLSGMGVWGFNPQKGSFFSLEQKRTEASRTIAHLPGSSGSDVLAEYQDRNGQLWFADYAGQVYTYRKSNDSWSEISLSTALHRAEPVSPPRGIGPPLMLEDGNGSVMLATDKGLALLTEATEKWELFDSKNSPLPGDRVHCISKDASGRIWIGTDKGLVVLERQTK
jgi:streptogramin lyase